MEEFEDVLARGCRVQGIAFAARQSLLILPPGCLLPPPECIPVEAVEPPYAARDFRDPLLEILPALVRRRCGFLARTHDRAEHRFEVGGSSPAQVDADLVSLVLPVEAMAGGDDPRGLQGRRQYLSDGNDLPEVLSVL